MSSLLTENIIKSRKEYAPKLEALINNLNEISRRLELIKNKANKAGFALSHKHDVDKLIKDLQVRLESSHKRFEQGEITIAIAGLEKAGKSTFINTLLGVKKGEKEIITTNPSRCTSVPISIRWSEPRQFTIEYYQSESEYVSEVVNRLIDGYNNLKQNSSISKVSSLAEFGRRDLDSIQEPEGSTFHVILTRLKFLQKNILTIRSTIDEKKQNPKKTVEDINELGRYTAQIGSDEGEKVDQSCARQCILDFKFDGGSENLRLIDTPGVDDPSPTARESTLRTISTDTDVLIILSKPDNKPDLTESHTRFYDSLSQLSKDRTFSLKDKSCIIVNRTELEGPKDAENHALIILRHIEKLKAWKDVFVIGQPFCLTESTEAKKAFVQVNDFLVKHLPVADNRAVEKATDDFGQLINLLRADIQAWQIELPESSNTSDWLQERFQKWISDYNKYLKRALIEARSSLPNQEFSKIASSYSSKWIATIKDEIISFKPPGKEELERQGHGDKQSTPIDSYKRELQYKLRATLAGFSANDISGFANALEDVIFKTIFPSKFTDLKSGESHEFMSALRFSGIGDLIEVIRGKNIAHSSQLIELLSSARILPNASESCLLRHLFRPALSLLDPPPDLLDQALKRFSSARMEEDVRLSSLHSASVWDFKTTDDDKASIEYYARDKVADGSSVLEKVKELMSKMDGFSLIHSVYSTISHADFRRSNPRFALSFSEVLNLRIGAAAKRTYCITMKIEEDNTYGMWLRYSVPKDAQLKLCVEKLSSNDKVLDQSVSISNTGEHTRLSWGPLPGTLELRKGETCRFIFSNGKDDVNFAGFKLVPISAKNAGNETCLQDDFNRIQNDFEGQIKKFETLKGYVAEYFEIIMRRQEIDLAEIALDCIDDIHTRLCNQDSTEFIALQKILGNYKKEVLFSRESDLENHEQLADLRDLIVELGKFCVF